MIKLKDLLKEISFQKVTVKDKKGKSHTQQARIRRGTTHVLIIHWKAIEKTSFSSAQKAHTTLNFGTEADMKKMANREKLHKDRGKYIIGTEIQKLDSKYIKEGVLSEAKKPVKYYLDYTEDDLKKYVVADKDDNLYLGVAGLKKGSRYIKFRITRPGYKSKFNIRMDAGKIKEVKKARFKQAVNAFGMDVDLDKLYRG